MTERTNEGFEHDAAAAAVDSAAHQSTNNNNDVVGTSSEPDHPSNGQVNTPQRPVVVEISPPENPPPDCFCCSWSKMCDVLGNRQDGFINCLRPIRNLADKSMQSLAIFRLDVERDFKLSKDAEETDTNLAQLIDAMNGLGKDTTLNAPPEEAAMLRSTCLELQLLRKVLAEKAREDREGIEEPHSKVDAMAMKDRITRNTDSLAQLLRFIDQKTERRWWLRDVINLLQVVIKILLFISAAISVIYHEAQIAPIITLSITIAQGIIEIMDQYLLKHVKPDQLRVSVITQMPNYQNNL